MSNRAYRAKRDMQDISQALRDCADELHEVAEELRNVTAKDYLVHEISMMVGVRVKLAYNTKKLKQLTGQEDPIESDYPF